MKPNRREKIKWSFKLAYAVGLITTDGSLSIDRRHIDLTSKDLSLLKSFKKCLSLKVKIGIKSSGSSDKEYYHVQFGDVVFYKWLEQIGLTPRKSKTLSGLRIPNKYFSDFLRGCFDGDGTIFSYWDRRWHSSFMFYIAFTSGSSKFLNWLQNKNNKMWGLKGCIGKSGDKNTFILRYAKKESKILFDRMFYSNNIPFLKRKYIKALKIFEVDKNHNRNITKKNL